MPLGSSKTPVFSEYITGTWGVFKTPSGEIHYLETKAQLWADQHLSQETKLTDHLVPVRELLTPEKLDFNQLLQRDLDDHRVATELVPYLLRQKENGAAFFPPIVATFLPFSGNEPRESYDEYIELEPHEDEITSWRGYRFGNSLQFEWAYDAAKEEEFEVKIGRVKWNKDAAKLVVIDGQHRAMAMLAINRTINKTWNGSGEKYKFFYEDEIRKIQEKSNKKVDISGIEIPVTLVWFHPQEENFDHHKAARRLFVDVNKNAKAPSESRILLLEDNKLTAHITRGVLNKFRNTNDGLPIYAIEYDHPGKDQARFAKWSVISNINIIESAVKRTLFGPKKYIDDLKQRIGGREREAELSQFFRRTLDLDNLIPQTIPEEGFSRENLTDSVYPSSFRGEIEERALNSWGGFIVSSLSRIEPYHQHGEALRNLYNQWSNLGDRSALAKNAIFDGVGMYWTIRDSFLTWQEVKELRGKAGALSKTDIVRAWDELEEKRSEFLDSRARLYGNSSRENHLSLIKQAYDILGTNACQVGLFLAARTIAHRNGIKYTDMRAFGEKFIAAVNAGLAGGPGVLGRRAIFARSLRYPLVKISKLDTPMAVYFRYYWFELLCSEEGRAVLEGYVDMSDLEWAAARAREAYFEFRVQEQIKALRKADASISSSRLRSMANETEAKDLRKALGYWFGRTELYFPAPSPLGDDVRGDSAFSDVEEDDVSPGDSDSDTTGSDGDYWEGLQGVDESDD